MRKQLFFLFFCILILSSCGGAENDDQLSCQNVAELIREVDIKGDLSPNVTHWLCCLVEGPGGAKGNDWNAVEMSRNSPEVFQWWVKECEKRAYQ